MTDINKEDAEGLEREALSNWHQLNAVLESMTSSTVYRCLILELANRRRLGIVERLHTRFTSLRKRELKDALKKFVVECEKKRYGPEEVQERLTDFYLL